MGAYGLPTAEFEFTHIVSVLREAGYDVKEPEGSEYCFRCTRNGVSLYFEEVVPRPEHGISLLLYRGWSLRGSRRERIRDAERHFIEVFKSQGLLIEHLNA